MPTDVDVKNAAKSATRERCITCRLQTLTACRVAVKSASLTRARKGLTWHQNVGGYTNTNLPNIVRTGSKIREIRQDKSGEEGGVSFGSKIWERRRLTSAACMCCQTHFIKEHKNTSTALFCLSL